jgi:hypothetical protein
MFRLCLYAFHENKNSSFSEYKNPRSSVSSNVHHNLENLIIIPKVTKLMKLIRFKLINLKYKLPRCTINYDLRIASPNDLKVTIIINYIFRPRKARSDLRAN